MKLQYYGGPVSTFYSDRNFGDLSVKVKERWIEKGEPECSLVRVESFDDQMKLRGKWISPPLIEFNEGIWVDRRFRMEGHLINYHYALALIQPDLFDEQEFMLFAMTNQFTFESGGSTPINDIFGRKFQVIDAKAKRNDN